MTKKLTIYGLVAAALLQLSVLAVEFGGAHLPLVTGQEVQLATRPVDPRSLFRGNYARLNYDISTIPSNDLASEEPVRNGDVVYVSLKPIDNGLYGYEKASIEKPKQGVYLRGRIQNRWRGASYRVKYGIEAFFAEKEKALALERSLPKGGRAVVMVASSGRAALKEVVAQ